MQECVGRNHGEGTNEVADVGQQSRFWPRAHGAPLRFGSNEWAHHPSEQHLAILEVDTNRQGLNLDE